MNNQYLIDTHVFVWWRASPKRLDQKIRTILENSKNDIYLSMTSIWEMQIKYSNGKLDLPEDWLDSIKSSNFNILTIEVNHIAFLPSLPPIHKDPFDRMLAAQAKTEKFILITADQNLLKYPVKTLNPISI